MNKIFKITEDFRIEKSKLNFTLQELKEVKCKKTTASHKKDEIYKTWIDSGYYMSVKAALKAFVVKFTDRAAGVDDLLDRFDQLENLYAELGEMG